MNIWQKNKMDLARAICRRKRVRNRVIGGYQSGKIKPPLAKMYENAIAKMYEIERTGKFDVLVLGVSCKVE